MPELDYAISAEHVRIDGGIAFIVAANIDTLAANQTPVPWNLAFFLGFRLGENEPPGHTTPVELVLRNQGGDRLVEVQGAVTIPPRPPELPEDWPMRASMALNIGFVAPAFGFYYFEVIVGNEVIRTLPLRVVESDAGA